MGDHYVCKGECGGVSETQGACGNETCSMHGEMMEACNCNDGQHGRTEIEAEVAV